MKTSSDDPQRGSILDQVLDARTLPKIAAATQQLRDWLRQNPEDTGISEAFEGLSLMQDIVEEQKSERIEARRRVSDQVLQANTLPEIEAAKQVLRDWLKAHPDEQGMRDGFEQLYTIQEIIEDENARRAVGEVIPLPPPERERILAQAADARTLPEKPWAAYELWDWQRRNPEDADIRAAMKELPRIDDDEEEQEAERNQESRLPVQAGQAA